MARHIPLSSVLLAALTILGGVLGGAVGGWVSVSPLEHRLAALEAAPNQPAPTSTTPTYQVVPVEAMPTVSVLPSSFLSRRSPVLSLVKKADTLKSTDEKMLSRDHAIGEAVALTSDGWLATTYTAIASNRLADLAVVWEGNVYPITQAVRDTATGAVFVKIDAHDLSSTAFVRPEDVLTGAAVWVESSARRFSPDVVADVRGRLSTDVASSEKATRRFLLVSTPDAAWKGSAVWDMSGRLVGLLESHGADGWAVLPSSDLSSALASLLSTKEIRHASLGVHAIDLGSVALFTVSSTASLPEQGAWLKVDRRAGVPAVTVGGPAAGQLKEGDVIERLERDTLDGTADLGERLLDYRPGTTIALSGQRQNKSFEVTIRLGSVVTSEWLK